MSFKEINGSLCVEEVPLTDIAKDYGTPSYVYSSSLIRKNFENYSSHLRKQDKLCFAVKANSNIHLLEYLKSLGSGFDVVSGGELKKSLLAGASPENIVFSGVGKSYEEIELAIQNNIFSINLESENELKRVIQIAKDKGVKANCSIRINPDISTESHPFIETGNKDSKFGISSSSAFLVSNRASESGVINIVGLASHIGSQIFDKNIILENLRFLVDLTKEFREKGHLINTINLGGGLGIRYKDEPEILPSEFMKDILDIIEPLELKLIFEPGRSIIGNAGVLLTSIEYLKKTDTGNFAILDSGMNDLIRPSLYDAWHKVSTLEKSSQSGASPPPQIQKQSVKIVQKSSKNLQKSSKNRDF